jgi:hypothetical protein
VGHQSRDAPELAAREPGRWVTLRPPRRRRLPKRRGWTSKALCPVDSGATMRTQPLPALCPTFHPPESAEMAAAVKGTLYQRQRAAVAHCLSRATSTSLATQSRGPSPPRAIRALPTIRPCQVSRGVGRSDCLRVSERRTGESSASAEKLVRHPCGQRFHIFSDGADAVQLATVPREPCVEGQGGRKRQPRSMAARSTSSISASSTMWTVACSSTDLAFGMGASCTRTAPRSRPVAPRSIIARRDVAPSSSIREPHRRLRSGAA